MIELKEVIDEETGKKRILLHDRLYSIRNNPIGVREKFWIVRRGGKIIKESPLVTDILFKYNRNDVSCEDYGEVLACNIMRHVGLQCVDYYLAKTTKLDGQEIQGVLCGSYKRNNDEIEMSAYDIQTKYTQMTFDPETGVANKQINTVYGIIEDIQSLYQGYNNGEFMIPHIQNDLVKQALMDYTCAQTDRHWLNTTFLEVINDIMRIPRKSKCYDNGCIAYLKRKREAIKTISNQFKGDYVTSPRMHELMDNYCPMFGIKTSTVVIDTDRYNKVGNPEKLKLKGTKKAKETFLDELTDEILYNPEIAIFYKHMVEKLKYDKKSINLDPIIYEIFQQGDRVDDYIVEMVKGVMTYQISTIENVLNKKLEDIRNERKSKEEDDLCKN